MRDYLWLAKLSRVNATRTSENWSFKCVTGWSDIFWSIDFVTANTYFHCNLLDRTSSLVQTFLTPKSVPLTAKLPPWEWNFLELRSEKRRLALGSFSFRSTMSRIQKDLIVVKKKSIACLELARSTNCKS